MNRRFLLAAPICLAACHGPPPRPPARARPPPAPPRLIARLEEAAWAFNGEAGLAVLDLERGWTASVQGERRFGQQSVSKIWVAMHTLDQIDRGHRRLNDFVLVRREDLSVFSQPLAREATDFGYVTNVGELLKDAVGFSDNAADDMLIRLAGGAAAIEATLRRKGLYGIRIGADQRRLQCRIAGLEWRPEFVARHAFEVARARVPASIRQARIEEYVAAPPDGATPLATVRGLAALRRGRLLSAYSTAYLLTIMGWSPTGPRRLRGGLGPGWSIAHKTGTGQEWNGAVVGVNDVGVLTAPDGHAYAVAVFIARTAAALPLRLQFMQDVARAVVDQWARDGGAVSAAG